MKKSKVSFLRRAKVSFGGRGKIAKGLAMLRLATPKRVWNLVKNRLEFRRLSMRVSSVPVKLTVDITNICNLKCPLCSTGSGALKQSKANMPLELFQEIYRPVADRVAIVNLFNWGEAFLNREVFDIIDEVHAHRAWSGIHSNLSLKNWDMIEKIGSSNLSTLVLSIDGATQDTYRTYRWGGDLDLVKRNIRTIVETRKRTGKNTPEINWKFIVNKKNEHELDLAVDVAEELGVDSISFTPIYLADFRPGTEDNEFDENVAEEWLPVEHEQFVFESKDPPLYDGPCPHLWESPVINADGTIAPCCFINDSKYIFGDLKEESFETIWNNDRYRYSRSLFSEEKYDGPEMSSVCDSCRIYKQCGSSAKGTADAKELSQNVG